MTSLVAALLAWYRAAARPLPWRATTDPYRVWLSEVMLQQTQVATVLPYYARFLTLWPTVEALAAAPRDEVLAAWQGLGYYRRAHALHETARLIVERGGWPTELVGWRALPGFGDYTAGALASIVGGERVPAVDGNVERVLARLLALEGDPARGAARATLRAYAAELVPAEAPGEWNQAVMELGATICGRQPRCGECPVAAWCAGLAGGTPAAYPRREPRPAPRERLHAAAVIGGPGGYLLGQRPPGGRWAGLWELPRVELDPAADARAGLAAHLRASLGVDASVGAELGRLRHAVSGERIVLVGLETTLAGAPRALDYEALLVSDPANLAMPIWQKRLLAQIEDPG